MESFAHRWTLRLGVALLTGIGLLGVARDSDAESRTSYSPSNTRCYISATTNAQYFPGDDAYGAEGQSVTTYHNSQPGCSPTLVNYYLYIQTRGWNNDLGWHFESHEDVGYPYLCCYYVSTPWTYACGGYVCDQANWYISSYHYYKETPSDGGRTVYTSHDGQHSTSGCFFSGC